MNELMYIPEIITIPSQRRKFSKSLKIELPESHNSKIRKAIECYYFNEFRYCNGRTGRRCKCYLADESIKDKDSCLENIIRFHKDIIKKLKKI